MRLWLACVATVLTVCAAGASAADYPKPVEHDWVAKDFRFHTGEVMPELKLHYTTIGDPRNPPVLMLHGSGQSGTAILTAEFAGELFGAGQPLDATKYFVILPDGLGHGKSTKPSDELKAKFPKYDYDDMVDAHYRLLTEGMGIKHLRLVMGNSMGGMHAWLWAGKYPDFMDAVVPMASQPIPMAARNWMMRRLIIDTIKNDPDYHDGNYTTQPKGMKAAVVFFQTAMSGGTLAYSTRAATREAADKILDERLAAPFTADANDLLYQWASSGDFDPTAVQPKVQAKLLAINAADDERNPPETGLTEKAMGTIKDGRASLYLIPASPDTRGHATTAQARFYTKPLAAFLQDLPAPVR